MNPSGKASLDVGERIRLLRMASGKSQTGLSEELGLKGNTVLSKIETGRMPMDDELAVDLAAALGCSTDLLRRPCEPTLGTKPWLRAYADASARVVDQIRADNQLANEFFAWSDLRWIPDSLPIFDADVNDDRAIEEFASHVRSVAEVVEGGPVRNAVRASERLGCIILPLESELGRHLGLSQRMNGHPFIRLSRAWNVDGTHHVPGDRQRFTVSHELGHLALHSEAPPPQTPEEARRLEKQANRFAAAFLAPADPLLDDWHRHGGRATLGVLLKLKATWGVAVKMLVTRFRQLNIIDDDHARSLYRQISARGWNRAEPVEVSNEEPIWLARSLSKSFPAPSILHTQRLAAEHFGLAPHHLDRWMTWRFPEGLDRAVVRFQRRTKAVGSSGRRTRGPREEAPGGVAVTHLPTPWRGNSDQPKQGGSV